MKTRLLPFKLFCLSLIGLLVFSCIPQTKMKYLQNKEGETPKTEFQTLQPGYILKPGDYLNVRVLSLDQKSNELFSSVVATGGANMYTNSTEQELYLKSFMVNDSGYINFPLLGYVYAKGLSVAAVEKSLTLSMDSLIKGTSVVVKLVLYNISILGEVNSPGQITIYNSRVNIFQAFALANDLTGFADRSKVQIVRTDGTKTNIIVLNVLDKDIISSPYYYLQPNDVIYVEPMKSKSFAFETFPYGLVYSTIGLALVILTFFK